MRFWHKKKKVTKPDFSDGELSDLADVIDPDRVYLAGKDSKMIMLKLAMLSGAVMLDHNNGTYVLTVGDEVFTGTDQNEVINQAKEKLL